MKKIKFLILINFIAIFTTACFKKTLYFTPEAVGYIYDSQTRKPLKNQTGDMGFNGRTNDHDAILNLKSDGSFTIPAVIKTYYFIKPDENQYRSFPAEIFIRFKNYESKIVDYSEAFTKQVPEKQSSFINYKKINLGIIYLDPQK